MDKLNNKWLISSINNSISSNSSQPAQASGINQQCAKITNNSYMRKEDECENTKARI